MRRVTIKPGHTCLKVAAPSRVKQGTHMDMFVGDALLQPSTLRLLSAAPVSFPFCLSVKSVEGMQLSLMENSVSYLVLANKEIYSAHSDIMVEICQPCCNFEIRVPRQYNSFACAVIAAWLKSCW